MTDSNRSRAPIDAAAFAKARIDALVDEHGWAVQYVGGGPSDDEIPFAYSIGLAKRKLPDVLMIAPVDPDTAYGIVNDVARMWIASPLSAAPGDVNGVLEGLPIRVRRVDDLAAFHGYALGVRRWNEQHGVTIFGAMQIVLPDAQGRFPGDKGFDWFAAPAI